MSDELSVPSFIRRKRLLDYVERQEQVSIAEICERFAVSPATARRDLEALSRDARVQRVHGGAIAIRNAPPEPPLAMRSSKQAEEKRRIGQAASLLISDGETIFLGSGTTVLQVAKALQNRHDLTVITNSLLVMDVLRNATGIHLVGLGGILRQTEQSFIGHITELALSEVRVDKVVMGIRAIDVTEGLTNDYLPETQTDRAILKIGQQVIIVADHTKCGRVSTAFVAPLTAINTLVTDDKVSPDFVAAVSAQGVRVLTV